MSAIGYADSTRIRIQCLCFFRFIIWVLWVSVPQIQLCRYLKFIHKIQFFIAKFTANRLDKYRNDYKNGEGDIMVDRNSMIKQCMREEDLWVKLKSERFDFSSGIAHQSQKWWKCWKYTNPEIRQACRKGRMVLMKDFVRKLFYLSIFKKTPHNHQ